MGKWATTHSSKCFDNQPSFFHLLLETCQQDKLALVAAQMHEQLEVACWEVHLRCLNLLLAEVVGADITQAILCGKSARISAQVGHPDFLLRVDMGKNTSIHMTEAAASYTKYLHSIAETFCSSIADNSPCMVVCEFHRASETLISHVLKSYDSGVGMFGKTLAFLASIEHSIGNKLVLQMLLWTPTGGPKRWRHQNRLLQMPHHICCAGIQTHL